MTKNNRIFLVTGGQYSDYHIEAAFSTRELAERYIGGNTDEDSYDYLGVEEFELDSSSEQYRKYWLAEIDLCTTLKPWRDCLRKAGTLHDNGHPFKKRDFYDWELAKPSERGRIQICHWEAYTSSHLEHNSPEVTMGYAKSFISQEHANKLAIELYQNWLREGRPVGDFKWRDENGNEIQEQI